MDHFQEYKKQRELSEGIFDKVLGKNEPKVPENPDFIQKPNGTFVIGGKSTAKEVNTPGAIPFLKEFDWRNSKLNFVLFPGTEFHAKYINFDLKTQTISLFKGEWESGPFYGEQFEGTFGKHGTAFKGDFVGRYTDYEADPKTFLDGTFLDTTESGLLGMPNVVSLHKVRNKKFNFIAIPTGNYLQFRSANGITGYIKVLKRLNEVNSTFQYEVLDGFKGQTTPQLVTLPWDYFRQNWDILYTHPRHPRNIAGLIIVPEGDSIIEMHISSAPATFASAPETIEKKLSFEPGKKYSFDLSKLPISIEGVAPEVTVAFETPQELEEFQKVSNYVNSGTFKFDMRNIQRAIQYNEIDGYGTFNYLSSLFNNVPGKNIMTLLGKRRTVSEAPEKGKLSTTRFKEPGEEVKKTGGWKKKRPNHVSYTVPAKNISSPETTQQIKQDAISSMDRLNNFVKYFVANIVDANGSPDVTAQTAVMNSLRTSLGTTKFKKPAVASTTTAKDTTKGLGLHEDVRLEIRRIINNNL